MSEWSPRSSGARRMRVSSGKSIRHSSVNKTVLKCANGTFQFPNRQKTMICLTRKSRSLRVRQYVGAKTERSWGFEAPPHEFNSIEDNVRGLGRSHIFYVIYIGTRLTQLRARRPVRRYELPVTISEPVYFVPDTTDRKTHNIQKQSSRKPVFNYPFSSESPLP